MSDTLVITVEATAAIFDDAEQHVWPLKMTAVSTIANLPSKIFVYHESPDQWLGSAFEVVASVPQLVELPEDAAADVDGERVPYFRKDTLELWLRSPQLWTEVKDKVLADIRDLVTNVRATEQLKVAETITIE